MAPTRQDRFARLPARGVTAADLREAERGLRLILARNHSAAWIAENARDLLGQASAEYAEWLTKNPPARNPVGWLLTCARRRAQDLADRDARRPEPAPLDAALHIVDKATPTPEDVVLERDRRRRIAAALSQLNKKDQKLLALVYYEGHSIREAGRLLGLGKSSADSHHGEAMKELLALVGDRALLSPALIGLVAQGMVLSDRRRIGGLVNFVTARVRDLVDFILGRFGSALQGTTEAARRAVPLTDVGGGAASAGAGRVLAQCGAVAVVAVCGVLAAQPIERGVEALVHGHPATEQQPPAGSVRPEPAPAPEPTPANGVTPEVATPPQVTPRSSPSRAQRLKARRAKRRRAKQRQRAKARRHGRLGRARRARRAKASAEAEQSASEEAPPPEEVESAPEEVAPEAEAIPESEPALSTPPPPASGGQARGEFGL